jgi:hypothetical protein
MDAKPKISRAVSKYMGELARRTNAVLRGSESARIRSAKGVSARQRKRGYQQLQDRGSRKFAMNVLVRGEETPKVFLAPRTVAVEIITAFEGMLEEKLTFSIRLRELCEKRIIAHARRSIRFSTSPPLRPELYCE